MAKVVAISEFTHELLKKIVAKQKQQGRRAKQGEIVDNLIIKKAEIEKII